MTLIFTIRLLTVIAKVLSEEAGKIFRFKQQEELHEKIIDDGLSKIYRGHLQVSKKIAGDRGVEVKTTLLPGKPYNAILEYLRKERPDLLILGKVGIHKDDRLDIGSNAENLLRLAPCHIILTSRRFVPPVDAVAQEAVSWTKEAEARMERVQHLSETWPGWHLTVCTGEGAYINKLIPDR